jgi:hypothetical protein
MDTNEKVEAVAWESSCPIKKTAAAWESSCPVKATLRRIPAIFLNLEVGLSFEKEKTHSASMKYASKKMEDKLHEQRIRLQYEEGRYSIHHPAFLMPANGIYPKNQMRQQQNLRQRRLGVNTREQHLRGTSAPPTTFDRTQPISPESPVSPVSPISIAPTRSATHPVAGTDRPLPPTPSQFRLGEENMPWSMTPFFIYSETEYPKEEDHPLMKDDETPLVDEEANPFVDDEETLAVDDPKHPPGDLEALHLAMMAVDTFSSDAWEPPAWGTMKNYREADPLSIGWAVSSHDALPTPPPQLPPLSATGWEYPLPPSPPRPSTATV